MIYIDSQFSFLQIDIKIYQSMSFYDIEFHMTSLGLSGEMRLTQ